MKLFVFIFLILISSFVIWVLFGLFIPSNYLNWFSPDKDYLSSLSDLGSAFGGANALFSSLALFLLMISVWLQQKELEETRKELKKTAEAQQQMVQTEKKALALQIIMPFMDEISSSKMRESIIFLADFARTTTDFSETFEELLLKRKNNTLEAEEKDMLDMIDSSRRRFVMIFHRMDKLFQTKVVDEEIIKVVIGPDHVKLLLDVIEPLEKAIRLNYSREVFEFAKELYEDEELESKGRH